MIIIMRGTNGSGKSYAMRKIIAQNTSYRIYDDATQSSIIALDGVQRKIVIIGPYQSGRSMGGCDCIRRPSEIYRVIDRAISVGHHVLLEGVVLARKPFYTYTKRGHDVRLVWLDTPIQTCLNNIAIRQRKNGRKITVSSVAMQRKYDMAQRAFYEGPDYAIAVSKWMNSTGGADQAVQWIRTQLRNA